jgi:hypothetical protein
MLFFCFDFFSNLLVVLFPATLAVPAPSCDARGPGAADPLSAAEAAAAAAAAFFLELLKMLKEGAMSRSKRPRCNSMRLGRWSTCGSVHEWPSSSWPYAVGCCRGASLYIQGTRKPRCGVRTMTMSRNACLRVRNHVQGSRGKIRHLNL